MRPRGVAIWMFLSWSALAGACKDIGDPVANDPLPSGSPRTYAYKGFNSNGVLVVTGTLRLTCGDDQTIEGGWSLGNLLPDEQIGPQTGTGTLRGTLQGTSVSLNLNPGWVDNNVFLSGTFGKDGFSGTWTWVTFVGPTASGKFEAVWERNQVTSCQNDADRNLAKPSYVGRMDPTPIDLYT